MSKKVPYKQDYDLVGVIERLSKIILYLSVIVSSLSILAENSNLEIWKSLTSQKFISLNSFLAVCYFLTEIFLNYLFQAAEGKRRNDFIDHSLNTKLSEEKSEEYFTNDEHDPGINKLGVNCFENSYFTKSVAQKMLFPKVIQSIIIILMFIAVALFTDNKWLTFVLQLALPLTIINQTIRICIFHHKIKRVFHNFQLIFHTTQSEHKQQLIIHNVINYETTLSWACIKLDSKIFTKMNPELSEKWEKIKEGLNLKTGKI